MHGPMLALLHIMFWPPGCKDFSSSLLGVFFDGGQKRR